MDGAERWLSEWRQQSEEDVAARFRARGAPNPERWASADMRSANAAHMAAFLFGNAIWRRLTGAREDAVEALAALDLDESQRLAAEEVVVRSLWGLASGIAYLTSAPGGSGFPDPPHADVDDDGPSWRLVETTPDREQTGRFLDFIHEILISAAPGGEDWARSEGWI